MRPIILVLALGACVPAGLGLPGAGVAVPPGEVRVTRAVVTASTVTLRLSNGERCLGARPEGTTGNWTGVTAECGYALPYAVFFRQGGSRSRYIVEAPGAPLAPDGTPGPRAEVFVTDVDGQRRLFTAPLSNVRLEVAG